MRKKLEGVMQKLKWLDPFTYVDLALDKYWPAKNNKKTEMQEIGYNVIYVAFAFVFAFLIYQILSLAFATSSPIVIVVSESMEPKLYRGDVVFIQGTAIDAIKVQEMQIPASIGKQAFSQFGTVQYSDSKDSRIGKEVSLLQINSQSMVPNANGDIILYYSYFTGEQIIHRAFLKIKANDGSFLLTKGDNKATNWTFDQDCGKVQEIQIAGTDQSRITLEKPCITLYPLSQKDIQGRAVFTIPALGCVKVWVFDDLPSLLFKGKMPDNYRGGFC